MMWNLWIEQFSPIFSSLSHATHNLLVLHSMCMRLSLTPPEGSLLRWIQWMEGMSLGWLVCSCTLVVVIHLVELVLDLSLRSVFLVWGSCTTMMLLKDAPLVRMGSTGTAINAWHVHIIVVHARPQAPALHASPLFNMLITLAVSCRTKCSASLVICTSWRQQVGPPMSWGKM